jgi:uncharacterized protein DUF4157
MNRQIANQAQQKSQTATPVSSGILQRKCACGTHTMSGGECAECTKKIQTLHRASLSLRGRETEDEGEVPPIVHEVLRSPGQPLDPATRAFFDPHFGHDSSKVRVQNAAALKIQPKLIVNEPGDRYEQEADRIAATEMRLADPGVSKHMLPPSVQRLATGEGSPDAVPPIVHDVISSPGQPLDATARAFFEPRFGRDFSCVRVHTDAKAAQSAESVNAVAYTVGRNVVFGTDRYAPHLPEGKRLLAHELTHVVQQDRSLSAGSLQRQESRPRPAPVDADAQRIIDLAQDTMTPIKQRAVAVVQAIINQYFSADAPKISGINYRADEPGLRVNYVGSGAATTGVLDVGSEFVANTTQAHFARRVLQVRHEIEHIDQVRSGMAGENRSDEREFIAFYHEALAQELPGTSRMQHSTRVQLIDGALGYYYCLASELQSANAARRDELVARRVEEVRRSGRNDLGKAPSACRRQAGDRGRGGGGTRSGGLSGGAIAGIVLGAVTGAAAIGLGIAALAGAF